MIWPIVPMVNGLLTSATECWMPFASGLSTNRKQRLNKQACLKVIRFFMLYRVVGDEAVIEYVANFRRSVRKMIQDTY